MSVSITVFGDVVIHRTGKNSYMTGSLPGYVLRLLALGAGASVSADRLVDGIYDQKPPRSARAQLHAHISRLRKALGNYRSLIRTTGDGYLLNTSDVRVDTIEFERMCCEGAEAMEHGRNAEAIRKFSDALRSWGTLDVPNAVGARMDAALNRLNSIRVSALEALTDIQLRTDRRGVLVGMLEQSVHADPMDERLRCLLMRVYYLNGRQDRALQEFREIYKLLDDELGVQPGPEVQRVHAQILAQDPALLVRDPVQARPRQCITSYQAATCVTD